MAQQDESKRGGKDAAGRTGAAKTTVTESGDRAGGSGSGEQTSDESGSGELTSGESRSGELTSGESGFAERGSAEPGSAEPGTAEPGSAERGTAEPGSAEPGTAEPGSAEPGSAEPGSAGSASAARGSAESKSGDAAAGGRGGMLSGLVPKLAIAVAIVAVLIASALWWQYRAFYVDLDNQDESLRQTLEETRARLRRLEDEIESVRGQVAAGAAEVDGLRNDLDVLPAELRALGRRVEALQGGQLDARDNWLREQARYYLVLANTELAVGHRVGTAITALELADDVLRDLGEPNLVDVRNAIASELQSLRVVDVPDLERLAADLGGLGESAAELPLRAQAPQNFGAPEQSLDEVEPGLGRLWARTRGAVTSIVRVERAEEPVGPLLTEAERQIVRRELELELQMARTAVLDRRQTALRESLGAADGILSREFDRAASSVVEARRLLGEIMRVELDPALPDIGDSLRLLRNAPGAN